MKRLIIAAAVVVAATVALVVSSTSVTAERTNAGDVAAASTAVATHRQLWQSVTAYIATAANDVSEADYAYKPTDGVRTFGQLVAHIAGAQNLMCAAALGDPPRAEDEIEKTAKTKAALVAALKASTEYCARAYAQADAAAEAPTQLFGQSATRLYALGLNAVHNGEHYGNIVTYMRMKGMVPPSSRSGP